MLPHRHFNKYVSCQQTILDIRKGGNSDALQLEGHPMLCQSIWALIMRPAMHQSTDSTLLQSPLDSTTLSSSQLQIIWQLVGNYMWAKTAVSELPVKLLTSLLNSAISGISDWPYDLEHVSHVLLCTTINISECEACQPTNPFLT